MFQFQKARAKPLFYLLNLLFGGVIVGVAVVVCLRSLKDRDWLMITGHTGNSEFSFHEALKNVP